VVVHLAEVGHGEVRDAVAVEIPYRHRIRIIGVGADGITCSGGWEASIPPAEQYTHTAVRVAGRRPPVGHGDVGMAVAVKIPHRDEAGIAAHGVVVVMGGLEGAVALAYLHT